MRAQKGTSNPAGAAENPKSISGGRDFKYENTKFSRSDEANYVCVCVCVCVRARAHGHMLRLELRPILCGLIVEFKGASRKRGRN